MKGWGVQGASREGVVRGWCRQEDGWGRALCFISKRFLSVSDCFLFGMISSTVEGTLAGMNHARLRLSGSSTRPGF